MTITNSIPYTQRHVIFINHNQLLDELVPIYSRVPNKRPGGLLAETLAETIESGPLCITDLFQNKSVAYF